MAYTFVKDLDVNSKKYKRWIDSVNQIGFSSTDIINKIDQIADRLKQLGFEELCVMCAGSRQRAFARREDNKDVYVGTFLNTFTTNQDIPLWADQYINSQKYIIIGEVYRHNGTSVNSSIEINIYSTPEYSTPYYGKINGVEYCNTNGFINCERIRKFRVDISDKVLEKTIIKAVEELNKIQLPDYKKYEKNRNDYHQSTENQYYGEKN